MGMVTMGRVTTGMVAVVRVTIGEGYFRKS